ncbi:MULTISPECIES: RNA polymerase sigma factor [Bacillus]|uniref:RNA polymerase sigma factor n=1 Tax=Bacillus TaxID=1386 RepID=UPI00030C9927|nr:MULTISPECIES: RNA polymerase sigma factor [Bacillus]
MNNYFLEQLYLTKYDMIRNYLMKNGASLQDAEDIVQNTFYKAMTYEIHMTHSNPNAWLFKVAVNEYYNLCNKKKRQIHVEIDESFLEHFINHEEGDEWLIKKENADEVKGIINQMKPSYAQLLLLKYELDLSYDEIASFLDMKKETIRTLLYRARLEFKKLWRNTYE